MIDPNKTLQALQNQGLAPSSNNNDWFSQLDTNKGKNISAEPTLLDKIKSTGKAVGGAIISNEKNFADDISGALANVLPKSMTGVGALEEAQKAREETINIQLKGLKHAQETGGDKEKWIKMIKETTGQPITSIEDLYPALKKSNIQVVGDAGGVLLDILSAGRYGAATKTMKTGELAPKIVAPVVEQVAPKVLSETLKSIGKTTLQRATIGAGTGYAYDVSQNMQTGKTGKDILTPGYGALLGGGIPLVIGGIQAGSAITKATAPKLINSLIKPKQADFSYGKDPARTVTKLGITGNTMDDFADNIETARKDIGTKIGGVYENPLNANVRIDASDELAKIDSAIKKVAKGGKENQGIVTTLQNIKDGLLYEHTIDSEGNIVKVLSGGKAIPRDIAKLSPQEAFDLKQLVSDQTKFTGRPSDDKLVNSVLQDIYGGIKEKINKGVKINNPEIQTLNQEYADLTSALIATRNRDMIVKRADLISMPIKVGTAGAVISAVVTGGATIPVILAGVGAGVLDKALASTAVKTRVAAWLGSETPNAISKILKNNPQIGQVLLRTFPKFASQLGQDENSN